MSKDERPLSVHQGLYGEVRATKVRAKVRLGSRDMNSSSLSSSAPLLQLSSKKTGLGPAVQHLRSYAAREGEERK